MMEKSKLNPFTTRAKVCFLLCYRLAKFNFEMVEQPRLLYRPYSSAEVITMEKSKQNLFVVDSKNLKQYHNGAVFWILKCV